MAAGAVWAFYYIQGEDGEDRSHPNAFRLPLSSSSSDLTLADVLRHFPLPEPRQFHFRFRVNAKSSFFWLDVTAESHKVPLVNGRVICKLLRLARAPKQGLVFKRKPVLKWSTTSTTASTSSSAYDRPAKYSDAPAPETPPQSEPRAGSSSSLNGRGSAPSSGPPSRTGSGKRPEAAESFEDFLSGGQSTAPANSSTSVNLMSDDGAWEASDAPRSAASDFLSSMDPLAQQQQQQQQQRRAQAPPRSTEQPKFDDDGGQTVGPVTMAEMQKYAVSSDGSNVYNPKFIDKSTKSEDVRRAMEERERQMQADVEKAREELRQREQAKNQMNAMKDSANAVLGPKLKAWAEDNGRVKNIRTLLSTMHTVMWDDSKWTEVNMGKLIQTNDIKKQYRKAMIVVHPDKSSGRNAEQLLIAERVFAALNTAWDEFMKTNPC